MEIRKIEEKDNRQVAHLIRSILEDMGVPKVGTAYADTALDDMHKTYQKPRSTFYVILLGHAIVACGGIAPLLNYNGNLCELQKLYVSKIHRGKGLAKKILSACIATAKDFGFEGCYLETMPNMKVAQQLYLKNGFEFVKEPLGDTGHSACSIRMLKNFG